MFLFFFSTQSISNQFKTLDLWVWRLRSVFSRRWSLALGYKESLMVSLHWKAFSPGLRLICVHETAPVAEFTKEDQLWSFANYLSYLIQYIQYLIFFPMCKQQQEKNTLGWVLVCTTFVCGSQWILIHHATVWTLISSTWPAVAKTTTPKCNGTMTENGLKKPIWIGFLRPCYITAVGRPALSSAISHRGNASFAINESYWQE